MSLKTLENWKDSKNISSQYTNEDRISKSNKTAFIAKPVETELCLYYFRGYGEQKAMPRIFIRWGVEREDPTSTNHRAHNFQLQCVNKKQTRFCSIFISNRQQGKLPLI